MNSLRSRLILGSALIAVVPLAVAIVLLSRRIESTVRAQAASRLETVLGGLQAQLADDGETIAERIRIQARDPRLRRLFLVHSGGSAELAGFLAERRVLLGLDLVRIVDTAGVERVDGASVGEGEPVRLGAPGRFGAEAITLDTVAGDTALAMVARVPILYSGRPVGVLEGGVLVDAVYLTRLRETSGVELALSDPAGRALAATLAGLAAVAPPAAARESARAERVSVAGESYLSRTLPLAIGAPPHARISGFVPTASSDATILALQRSAALLGLLGLGLAIALALLWSSQVSRPVERLAAFSDRIARGEWDEPLTLDSVRELRALVASLDRMRADLCSQRDRLAVSERQAAWGQMARNVAHEVRNPLTPIAVSVADLKRSYDLRRPEFPRILDQAVRTIGEEVETLNRLLQEFADFGRLPPPRPAPCRVADLCADLATLYAGEIAAGRVSVTPPGRDLVLMADAGQLRQALVNLVKNGLEALDGAGRVTVAVEAADGAVEVVVADTGPGLTEEQRARLFVPGFTTKARGGGLGLTIVERIVNDHRGTITVDSGPGRGTRIRLRLPLTPAGAVPHDGPGRS